MNRNKEIKAREYYINEILYNAMRPKKAFGGIKYARDPITDMEYVRISDIRGAAVTLNITAYTLEDILTDVCKVILVGVLGKHDKMQMPVGIVSDGDELIKISPLFKERGLRDAV